jgi:hypothetical protein
MSRVLWCVSKGLAMVPPRTAWRSGVSTSKKPLSFSSGSPHHQRPGPKDVAHVGLAKIHVRSR